VTVTDKDLEEAIVRDAARAVDEYGRRERDAGIGAYYARVGPALERAHRRRRERLAGLLGTCGDPGTTRIIDVGCGDGSDLEYFIRLGWAEHLMSGVEIFEPALERARRRLPRANLLAANAAQLPFPDQSFDASLQTTVLSSIVDPRVRLAAVGEMFRVVRPGGLVISWDIKGGGRNPNLAGIDREEIRRLFAPYSETVTVERATLSMGIASRFPYWAARVLERFPFLLDHYVAYSRKE
jgi:ubiquinone/menaquinone biosynthesis C-methylase UbiE